MKINAGSIFGLTLMAAGLVFALFGVITHRVAPPPGSENTVLEGTSNAWYYVVAGGLLISGLAIAVISQVFTATPPPEVGSTKVPPKPGDHIGE